MVKWRERIDAAESLLKVERQKWRTCLLAYRGIFFPDEVEAERRGGVNHVISVLNRLVPRIYHREPNILTKPETDDEMVIKGSKAMKHYLQAQFKRVNVGRETRKVLRDTFLFNRGYAKIGYQPEFQEREDKRDIIGAGKPAFALDLGLDEREGALKDAGLSPEDVTADDRFASGECFAVRTHPRFVLWDPDAIEMEKSNWVAFICPRRVKEVHDSTLYNKVVRESLGASMPDAEVWEPTWIGLSGRPSTALSHQYFRQGWVKLLEVWDKQTGQVFVMTPDCSEYLREPRPWPYEMRGFPIRGLQFQSDPEKFWGDPDVLVWLPQVIELNEYRRKRRERVLDNITKWLIDQGVLLDDTIEKIRSRVEGDVAEVNLTDKTFERAVKRIDPGGTPPDLPSAEARAKEDLSNLSGLSQQRKGVQGTYLTATEASLIEVASKDFEGDRLSSVADFQKEIAVGFMSLTNQYKETDEIVSVIGAAGYEFYEVTKDLRGYRYDIDVVVGSSRFVSDDEILQKLIQLLMISTQSQQMQHLEVDRIGTSSIQATRRSYVV
jgi:hypothetical protein